jgi:hypothetical protein
MWIMDAKVWSAIAAWIALFLSLKPYLRALFRKGKIEISKHTSVCITHMIGTPNLSMYVSLKNIGGRTAHIKKIQIHLTRDGDELPILIGTGYFSDKLTQQLTMFTPIDLGSGEKWAHTVSFHEKWSRTQQQTFRALSSKVRDTINSKRFHEPEHVGHHQAEDEQVKEIQDQFNSNFKWLNGEYKGHLVVLDSDDKPLIKDEFKFTIFETESDQLRDACYDYRFGFGVYLPPSHKQSGLIIELTQ